MTGELPADIVTLVAEGCAAAPDVPAIVFEDGVTVSRAGLAERVERFAGYLDDRLEPGERVAIMTGNRAEFMIAWIAAAACGATLVAMNPAARDHDARHVLADSGAVMAIVDEERRPLLVRLRDELPLLRELVDLHGAEPDGLARYRGKADRPLAGLAPDPAAITNVYYTSGSTGPPKGCMVDHGYWIRFVDLYLSIYGLRPEDRLLTCLNFFYNDPPWQLLTALRAGTSFVAMRRFSVSRFWDVVRAHEITQLFGIASIPSLLMTADPSPADRDHAVRFAVQVGIPSPELHPRLVERWGFPWLELYGLTETGIVTAMPRAAADAMVGSGSVGPPVRDAEVRLRDEEGRDVPLGEVGELHVRAPGMMRGYLGRPDATAEAMPDGWFRTGDLLRADRRGFLYFSGRTKDLIRRGGENVAASEVEAVLRQHPRVAEAAVVPVPDDLLGEELKAHVRLAAGAGEGGAAEPLPPEELVAWCAERLAKHKVPRYVEYRTGDFPRTASMRIAKHALREADASAPGPTWDRAAERSPRR